MTLRINARFPFSQRYGKPLRRTTVNVAIVSSSYTATVTATATATATVGRRLVCKFDFFSLSSRTRRYITISLAFANIRENTTIVQQYTYQVALRVFFVFSCLDDLSIYLFLYLSLNIYIHNCTTYRSASVPFYIRLNSPRFRFCSVCFYNERVLRVRI